MASSRKRSASTEHTDTAVSKRVKESDVQQDHVHSRLLQLPPELRLSIYEYCFEDGVMTWLGPDFRPSPLVSTCRIIRREELKLYYQHSRFITIIDDCDAGLLLKFCKYLHEIDLIIDDITCSVLTEGRNWDNLLQWARWICEGEAVAVGEYPADRTGKDDIHQVVSAVTGIAINIKDWETCRSAIMELKAVVCALNADWAGA